MTNDSSTTNNESRRSTNDDDATSIDNDEEIQELLVIGAGPHGLSLVLRLLEPDADFLTDKERHLQAEHRHRMRPDRDVKRHIRQLGVGPRATLRKYRPPKNAKKRSTKKKLLNSSTKMNDIALADATGSSTTGIIEEKPSPPLSLAQVLSSVTVVDKFGGGWMAGWKNNFATLEIPKLRSLMNAHADPFDHRSLEFYAEGKGRGDELVTLPMLCQRNKEFKGPYQAPSTDVFHEFHDLLANAYGVADVVQRGMVQSIRPTQSEDWGSLFEVDVLHVGSSDSSGDTTCVTTIKTKRVVCAMGPLFRPSEAFWEASLRKDMLRQQIQYPSDRILKYNHIMSFIKDAQNQDSVSKKIHNLLIVGGGITSAQMALLALRASWCDKVTLIQRSTALPRHFDLDNKWMGPQRGKFLEEFWSMDHECRARFCQEERKGGSIPPEILQELHQSQSLHGDAFRWKEEVQISSVNYDGGDYLSVSLDDGTESQHDMIWLATGSETHIDYYSALEDLRKVLPIRDVQGLPILNKDLSWRAPPEALLEEPKWKATARDRFWCMGALAALQLGPDALNLIGARAGAVVVAQAVRDSFAQAQSSTDNSTISTDESSVCTCCRNE